MEIQHGSGDAHVFLEQLLRLLRLIDLEDRAFTGELYALVRHSLLDVVNLHDAKVICLYGSLQGRRRLTHGYIGG